MIWLKQLIKHYLRCFQKPKYIKLNFKASPTAVNNFLTNWKVKLINSMNSKKSMKPLKNKIQS